MHTQVLDDSRPVVVVMKRLGLGSVCSGVDVMHCDWFVHWQVQRLQAVPTLPLALVKLLRLPRKHKLLQLVRSLQHCVT